MLPFPMFVLGGYDVVVAVEKYLFSRCCGCGVASELGKYNGVVGLTGVDHLCDCAKVVEDGSEKGRASSAIGAILGK